MTIDQLIAAHWGDCDVMKGETPEAYAIRHQQERLMKGIVGWWTMDQLTARLRAIEGSDARAGESR